MWVAIGHENPHPNASIKRNASKVSGFSGLLPTISRSFILYNEPILFTFSRLLSLSLSLSVDQCCFFSLGCISSSTKFKWFVLLNSYYLLWKWYDSYHMMASESCISLNTHKTHVFGNHCYAFGIGCPFFSLCSLSLSLDSYFQFWNKTNNSILFSGMKFSVCIFFWLHFGIFSTWWVSCSLHISLCRYTYIYADDFSNGTYSNLYSCRSLSLSLRLRLARSPAMFHYAFYFPLECAECAISNYMV